MALKRRWWAGFGLGLALVIFVPFVGLILLGMPSAHAPELYALLSMSGIFLLLIAMFIGVVRFSALKPLATPSVCDRCGAIYPRSDAAFCVKCGAELPGVAAPASIETERGENARTEKGTRHRQSREKACMVCNLAIEAGEAIAWCPYCGNAAHQAHLMRWVRAEKRCPACARPIDEHSVKRTR